MSGGTVPVTLASGVSLTTGITGGTVNVSPYTDLGGTIQFNFSYGGGDTSEGLVYIEASVDGTNWNTYPSSSLSYDSTTTSHEISITEFRTQYIRPVITNSMGTGGTATILGFFILNDK